MDTKDKPNISFVSRWHFHFLSAGIVSVFDLMQYFFLQWILKIGQQMVPAEQVLVQPHFKARPKKISEIFYYHYFKLLFFLISFFLSFLTHGHF